LINLLDNAVKYSPEGSLIEVRLTSEDNTARLSVTDHGCGIPKQEQERIFEPFYRIGAGAAKANGATGSGLGLALVLRAVQAHGGQVTLKSEPGIGSTFTITIPLQKGEDLTA
jgi:signal transduction histidine kinase